MQKMKQPIERTAQEVWGYLLQYIEDNSFMPTTPEIGHRFGFSHQYAQRVLKVLVEQGKIKIEPNKHRGIKLISK